MEFQEDDSFEVDVCLTGQHKELLEQSRKIFKINVNKNLDLMLENQLLAVFMGRAIEQLNDYFEKTNPLAVVVQGDTSTSFAAALAAYYNKIKVFHVEAGLRTYDKYSPFPEEINRALLGQIADFHFAPTEQAKNNLLKENVGSEKIFVTGNSSIDALLYVIELIRNNNLELPDLKKISLKHRQEKKIILITLHRRESFGERMISICKAIKILADIYPDFLFVYPVHPNPHVKDVVSSILGNCKNIQLIEPLDYFHFVALMDCSHILLTDSGGVQEEAPTLKKPVLVLRHNTERPEGVASGCAKLIGTDPEKIIEEFKLLMEDPEVYRSMIINGNPYGDGKTSKKILKIVKNVL